MTNTPTTKRIRTRIALTAALGIGGSLGGLLITRPVWAHTPTVSASCADGTPTGHVNLIKYPAGTVVTVNGAPHTFAGAYAGSYPLGSPTEAHTFTVTVVSPDGIGNVPSATEPGVVHLAACQTPTTAAVPTITESPPTITEAPTTTVVAVEVGPPPPAPSTTGAPMLVECPNGETFVPPDALDQCPPADTPATTITPAGLGADELGVCLDGVTDVRGARCASTGRATPSVTPRTALPVTGADTGTQLAIAALILAAGVAACAAPRLIRRR